MQAPTPTPAEVKSRRILSLLTNFDMKGTLERALELFPDTKRVLVVSGNSDADKKMAAQAAHIAEPLKGTLEFEYSGGLSLNAMLKRAATLPPHSIIIFTQYNRDSSGLVTVAYEVEGMITKAANAPVFGLYDFNLINGGIGGSVIGVKDLGEKTASTAMDLLNGRFQLTQPTSSATLDPVPMFNWEQIKHWGGTVGGLPSNTVFVNRVPTFWEQYRLYVIGVVIFVVAQSFLIAALLTSRRKRRLAERSLQESEENLAITLHSIGDAVIATDPEGLITRMNETAQRLSGWSLADALGRPLAEVFQIVNAGTRETVLDPVQLVMAHGEVVGLANHTVLLSKGGQEYHIADSAAPIRNAADKIVGVVLVFSDVTEQYRAEEVLQLTRFSVEAVSDAIFWMTPDARIVDVNAAACCALGYTREELLQLSVPDVDAHYNAELWSQHFAELRQCGSMTFESEQRTKDGRLFPVEIVANYVRHGDEERNCAFVRNITERKLVEAELSDSEERYRTLTEWSPEPLVVHDGSTFMYANPAAIKLFGANSAQELVGKPILDRVHPDFREIVGERMKLRPEPGGILPMQEMRFVKVDGTTIDAEVQSTSITYDGTAAIQVSLRDVTQSKQDQVLLSLQAQRAEALLRLPADADSMNETDFLKHGLGIAEQLTDSQIAFVHFVHEDQQNIERGTWSRATIDGDCKASYDRHRPVSSAGIWADALRQRTPVLINDYASASGKRGMPEGHTHLGHLISVPVIDAGVVRMMMGVGNKPQPYTDLDVETTSLVAQALYRIVSKHRSSDAMRQSQESLKEAQRIASIGSYKLNISTGHWESSEELDRIFGIGASFDRSVQSWEALVHPEDRVMMSEYFGNQVVGRHKTFDKQYRIVKPDDQIERWVHGLGRLEFDAQGDLQNMVGTIQDVTDRKQTESQIQALAFSDPLTGLSNRRLLMDRLEQALAAAARHGHQDALLFIDMDDFKTINDTLGHDRGDSLLKQIAQRLTSCVREGDTVARLGGDEFVVLLQDLSNEASEAVAQAQAVTAKILNALAQPYQLDDQGHHSSASIGVTLFGGVQRESVEEPLKRAELAMYQAKAAGRNSLRFFEPEMQTAVTTRATLEADLREAVNSGQFFLHYQPQGGEDARLSGVEALLRWQHPHRGVVSPLEFIPIAETSGLILPLGRWVLETACKQLATWATRPEMSHLTMAVNVSARQFMQAEFVEEVLTILHASGAKPECLKLELTESVLVDNVEEIIRKMNALKAKGVGFSLDDFGTGYSSLSYLKRLPLDQLKIDQSFVRDILTDPNDAAIAKMVVVLAESLGLSVIAEGVETEAQREFLAGMGCNNYQGYLFSRPLPIQEFEEFAVQGYRN